MLDFENSSLTSSLLDTSGRPELTGRLPGKSADVLIVFGCKNPKPAVLSLVKSWLIYAHAVTCGAVVGTKAPIVLTSRSAVAEETELSLLFCAVLGTWRKQQFRQSEI